MGILNLFPVILALLVFAGIIFLQRYRARIVIGRIMSNVRNRPLLFNNATGNHQGTNYRSDYFPGSKNSPPSLTVSIEFRSQGDFSVSRETGADAFFKKIGVSSEAQTHDEAFDGEFYILSNDDEFAARCFCVPENRQSARSIFDLGFMRLGYDGKRLSAEWRDFGVSGKPDEETVKRALDHLIDLSKSISFSVSQPSSSGRNQLKTYRFLLVALPVVLFIVGFIGLSWGLEKYPLLDGSVFFVRCSIFIVPALLFYLWFSFLLLKGHSYSHRDLGAVLMFSLIGFPVGFYGGAVVINGAMDRSGAVKHNVKVIEKYAISGKHGYTYHVRFEPWAEGRQGERLTVLQGMYDRIASYRTRLEVSTRAGALGYEWVEYAQIAESSPT